MNVNSSRIKMWQWLMVGVVLAATLDWLIQRPDDRARELNRIIEAQGSARLNTYPYRFRVLRVEGNTAVIATPRNVEVPAFRALGVLFPDIDVKNANNPAFIAAEKDLAAVQSEVRDIVQSQPGIAGFRWELDKTWLAAHGIEIPGK